MIGTRQGCGGGRATSSGQLGEAANGKMPKRAAGNVDSMFRVYEVAAPSGVGNWNRWQTAQSPKLLHVLWRYLQCSAIKRPFITEHERIRSGKCTESFAQSGEIANQV